jgi:hypothetical protein
LTVRVVDVSTGDLHDVGQAQVASDMNSPQWLPSGDTLLINRVQKP